MKQGYITEIKHDPNGRFGPSYQLYIDGKSMGFAKFPYKNVQVGDYVEYDTSTNDKGYENLKAGSLSKIDAPPGSTPPAAKVGSTITMDKQDVISRQAALNSALSFVELLQVAGALPEGKSLSADKKADKLESILFTYVKKFYEANTGSAYVLPELAGEEVAGKWDEQE